MKVSEIILDQYKSANGNSNKDIWGSLLYNVKVYGAKGDGSTNDTASIQAAIDAAFAAGGGIVFFPPGVYACAMLLLKDKVSLQGVNQAFDYEYDLGPSRLVATIGPHWLLRGNGANHVSIKNLSLVGQSRYTHGIDANIRCLDIECCQWAGFDVAIGQLNPAEGYGQQWHIHNNAIFNNNTGVRLSYDSKLFDNFIYTNTTGIQMDSSANCIQNNKIEFNDYHITMNPAERCTITNNVFDQAKNEAIQIGSGCKDLTFTGNQFMASGTTTVNDWQQTHLRINGANRINFVGNTFVKNYWEDGLKPAHIVTGATSTEIIFDGNNMSNGCSGDLISNPSDIRLKNNIGAYGRIKDSIVYAASKPFTFWTDALTDNAKKTHRVTFTLIDTTTTTISSSEVFIMVKRDTSASTVSVGNVTDQIGSATIGAGNKITVSYGASSDGSKLVVTVNNINAANHTYEIIIEVS